MPIRIVKHKNPKLVLFYRQSSPFSKFYPASFNAEIDGKSVEYNCNEQYFMYHKALLAGDSKSAEKILKMEKPLLMKKAGRELEMSEKMLKEWSSKSGDVMFNGCLQKFSQNQNLRLSLFRTNGMILAEASATDKIWGIGLSVSDKRSEDRKQWKGANKLGEILQKVRDNMWENVEFRQEKKMIEEENMEKRYEELEKLG